MVLPSASARSYFVSWNTLDVIRERMETIFGFLLGTSIPTVPLPGIGAIILIPSAERLSAMSFSSAFIRDILTPLSGTIS